MKVLLWGFYDQGNVGDDLMAIMLAEMVRSLGMQPTIVSANPRFEAMGYDVVPDLDQSMPDAIVLAGGAFLKASTSSTSSIERSIGALARFVEKAAVPVIGISIGSDGIECLEEASAPRRAVVTSKHFVGAAVRLQQDLSLGLRGAVFLPDIVFSTRFFRQSVMRGDDARIEEESQELYLLNLSRRSAVYLPLAFWLARGRPKAFFLAHSGENRVGGELAWPILPRVETSDMLAAIDTLGRCHGILSSKLHPGIMTLSMGRVFHSIPLRPKTQAFIEEYSAEGIVAAEFATRPVQCLRLLKGISWQQDLWHSYRDFISDTLLGKRPTARVGTHVQ